MAETRTQVERSLAHWRSEYALAKQRWLNMRLSADHQRMIDTKQMIDFDLEQLKAMEVEV